MIIKWLKSLNFTLGYSDKEWEKRKLLSQNVYHEPNTNLDKIIRWSALIMIIVLFLFSFTHVEPWCALPENDAWDCFRFRYLNGS